MTHFQHVVSVFRDNMLHQALWPLSPISISNSSNIQLLWKNVRVKGKWKAESGPIEHADW